MSVFIADWPAITKSVQRIFEQPAVGGQAAGAEAAENPERCG
jgi:hypothetical protein